MVQLGVSLIWNLFDTFYADIFFKLTKTEKNSKDLSIVNNIFFCLFEKTITYVRTHTI